MALTGKQRRALRALGHHLEPVVQVGHAGITDGVVAALEQALWDHELVKVKLGSEAPGGRRWSPTRWPTRPAPSWPRSSAGRCCCTSRNPEPPRIEI